MNIEIAKNLMNKKRTMKTIEVAKNLLSKKTCDTCSYLIVMTWTSNGEFGKGENCTAPAKKYLRVPECRTCDKWCNTSNYIFSNPKDLGRKPWSFILPWNRNVGKKPARK